MGSSYKVVSKMSFFFFSPPRIAIPFRLGRTLLNLHGCFCKEHMYRTRCILCGSPAYSFSTSDALPPCRLEWGTCLQASPFSWTHTLSPESASAFFCSFWSAAKKLRSRSVSHVLPFSAVVAFFLLFFSPTRSPLFDAQGS